MPNPPAAAAETRERERNRSITEKQLFRRNGADARHKPSVYTVLFRRSERRTCVLVWAGARRGRFALGPDAGQV